MNPLISTAQLAERLRSAQPPVILDVRWRLGGPSGRADYLRGHLPSAVYLDVDTDLASPPSSAGRHPLPDPESLAAILRAVGVRADRQVVAYDDGDGSIAARAWWLLRWLGHHDVGVLDGGFAAWHAEGRSITTEVPSPTPGDLRPRPGGMPVADADAAGSLARAGALLDARATARYTGETEPVDPRAGHIPGAINAPFAAHVDATGRWRTPPELGSMFAELGVVSGSPVGAYCGSGVTACSVVLALEYAGLTDVEHPAILYAGSWSNWAADSSRPIAIGERPG